MQATIKCVPIKVNVIKENFIVIDNNRFGVIIDIDSKSDLCTVEFNTIDGKSTVKENYQQSELKNKIAKFIAVMKDHKTFPISHQSFYSIINELTNPEIVESLLNGKTNFTCNGEFQSFYTMPFKDALVEITDIETIDEYGLHDKIRRVGVVEVVSKLEKKPHRIKLYDGTIANITRNKFRLLSAEDRKEVFKLK